MSFSKCFTFSMMSLPLLCAGNSENFPFPDVWHIYNKTNEPLTYKVIGRVKYPGLYSIKDNKTELEIAGGVVPQNADVRVERSFSTHLSFTVEPVRLEIISAQGQSSWSPTVVDSYDIEVQRVNGKLSVKWHAWSVESIKKYRVLFKRLHPGVIENYVKHVEPVIKKYQAEKEYKEFKNKK